MRDSYVGLTRSVRNPLRLLLGAGSLALLAFSIFILPAEFTFPGWPEFLLTVLVTAFMLNFSIPLPIGEGSLVHLVSLAAILAYSPLAIILAVALGVVLGDSIRNLWRGGPAYRDLRREDQLGFMALDVAKQVFTLLVATYGYLAAGGLYPFDFSALQTNFISLIGFGAGFYIASTLLVFLDLSLRGHALNQGLKDSGISLFILEFLPVPFAIFGALLNRQLGGFPIYVVLSLLVGVLAILMRNFGQARVAAEQHLREITLLNKVSEALRSSIDLDTLLQTIYTQVSSVLKVENFYIALYDHEADLLTFRISIRDGRRATWGGRPLANRLTDYIIRTGAPLRIPYNMGETFVRLGLEIGDNYPESWLGVPLIANERTIGCMAILSYDPHYVLLPESQMLMMAIGGPAGVALENARMYEQARRRATELSTLTEITTLLASSLDPEQVLDLICSAVIRVFNSQKSAIFLLAEDKETLDLVGSRGLTDVYLLVSRTLSLKNRERVRALQSAKPIITTDIKIADLSPDLQDLAAAEGFRAVAELPLVAHGEPMGFLAVFFGEPHQFFPDEIELLKTFASQAALAVSNAHLYARTDQALARRVNQLQALETISRELTSTFDLNKIFNLVVEGAIRFANADAGAMYLYNASQQTLLPMAAHGYTQPLPILRREGDRPLGKSITARVQVTGEVSLIADVRLDPDYLDVGLSTLSQLSVPIRREAHTLGVITLVSRETFAFGQDDAVFVSQLATQAAIAIQNVRYVQSVTETTDRLTAILNSTREGILVIDRNGLVILCNTRLEDLWNIQGGLLLGKNLLDLIKEEKLDIATKLGFTVPEINELLQDLHQGLAVTALKARFTLAAYITRSIERSIMPVLDDSLNVLGGVIALRDVTDEKELQDLRDDFTAMIVHDLRSPMTAVLSSLKLIEEMFVPKDETAILAQAVEVSWNSSKRILLLADSLLDISKMQAGQMELERRSQSLHPLVSGLLKELAPLAAQEEVILINQVPATQPPVLIDQEKVERVFINLIDNALKFVPPGGQVIVHSEVREGEVVCQVLDTGPGIPPDQLDRIFDPFAQVKGSLAKRRGTGLGLTFCKLTVEAHGGRIWVENRPAGGSVFSFTLPVAK